jgi:hypothetical protein
MDPEFKVCTKIQVFWVLSPLSPLSFLVANIDIPFKLGVTQNNHSIIKENNN